VVVLVEVVVEAVRIHRELAQGGQPRHRCREIAQMQRVTAQRFGCAVARVAQRLLGQAQ
jgi:hypothetical protein